MIKNHFFLNNLIRQILYLRPLLTGVLLGQLLALAPEMKQIDKVFKKQQTATNAVNVRCAFWTHTANTRWNKNDYQ